MPAVKDFHAISAERFFQTSQEYQMFGKECQAIPKTYLVFSVDKFSEFVHTVISLGCRKLGNSTLLIRLPNTVSNGLN